MRLFKPMCGRFALASDPSTLSRLFAVVEDEVTAVQADAQYNIAPSQNILAVRYNHNTLRNEFVRMKWGLIPEWAKKPDTKYSTFNARSEDVTMKPAFRSAYRKNQRCLIPTTGFYEWKGAKGQKQAYFIYCRNTPVFALAGLWDHRAQEGESLTSCTILTIQANELVSACHDRPRMPVIIREEDYEKWLTFPEPVPELMKTFPSEEMSAHPVNSNIFKSKEENKSKS